MHHYSDEVMWWKEGLGFSIDYWACQYPFVPGFFVTVLVENEDVSTPSTSYPIAGPFETLLEAIATINLIRP